MLKIAKHFLVNKVFFLIKILISIDRLTPTSRRNRNQSFAILAEPTLSRPGSRSPSPSGRVSPFRGRGFNPIGSRHASPIPSPTPPQEEQVGYYNTYTNNNSNNHNYGGVKKTGAGNYGDSTKPARSPRSTRRNHSKLSPQLSKSLTNIGSRVSNKPPPSPRRSNGLFSKTPAFQQLSPITGSSPDSPLQQQQQEHQQQQRKLKSSASKIPRSRSQPPSRKISPNTSRSVSPKNTSTSQENSRPSSRNDTRNGSRNPSRNVSRNTSRNPSRSESPNKPPITSPTRAKNKYSNIQPKVNSFHNRPKPKVPLKPNLDSEDSAVDEKRLVRKNSELKGVKNKSNSNLSLSSNKPSVRNNNKKTTNNDNNNAKVNNNKNTNKENNNHQKTNYDEIEIAETSSEDQEIKKVDSIPKLNEILPSTVVSSTTTTATQPLKIDAEEILKIKPTPMYMDEGRVLSATSVSSAINRMNDTVLDTQTLMKDHNFPKLSPAATAIISMSNETNRSKLALDPKAATTTLSPTVETVEGKMKEPIQDSDMDLLKAKIKNNINKLNSTDNTVGLVSNTMQKTGNGMEGRLEGRTVIPKEVKPIRITVKEKPMDPDVQSGNVRLSGSLVNGSLPEMRPS